MGELITGQAATYVEELWINTDERYEIRCITEDVERIVAESGIHDGLVLVNPMHITASCYVNDLEHGLHHDIMKWLDKIAPFYGRDGREGEEYHHHRTGEDNGDAHLKRQLLGQQVTMPVQNGKLHLGTWEQIHYAEFDGCRDKRILVKVFGILTPHSKE
jgi:secondary thiamine-phosphate synthase enzyme